MLTKLINYLQSKLDELNTGFHSRGANSEIPAEAEAKAVIRRFQGRYDCGHEVPLDVLASVDCPVHGEGCERVYRNEPLILDNVSIERM